MRGLVLALAFTACADPAPLERAPAPTCLELGCDAPTCPAPGKCTCEGEPCVVLPTCAALGCPDVASADKRCAATGECTCPVVDLPDPIRCTP